MASTTTLGNSNGRERDRVAVGRDGSTSSGRGRGGGGGGGGGLPGTQRIVTPSAGMGAGRVVDGRGGRTGGGRGRGGATGKDAEFGGGLPGDMEETCRRICKTLKEDCKVGGTRDCVVGRGFVFFSS